MTQAAMNTLSALLAEQARLRPDAPAVLNEDLELTWSRLADLTFRLSSHMRSLGVSKGDHVAFLCTNRPAYLLGWFALANVGCVVASVNTALVGEGLRHSLRQCDAKMIVIERVLWEEMQSDLEPLLADTTVVVFDGEGDLIQLAEAQAPDAVFEGDGSEPLSIIYTSGTTGLPKGVLNCHNAFVASGFHMVQFLGITEADRIMVFLPLFHTNPQMYAVMSALHTGCALVIRPKFSASGLFEDARRFGCTMFTYVGTVLAMLCARIPDEVKDHPLTRCVGGGCPPVVWRQMQERFGINPHELYGMTEVGGWVTGNHVDSYRFGSCGTVRPDVDVQVVDALDRPVPSGETGEIVVRPIDPFTLLLGYYNNPVATAGAMRNLWFHTGDVGRFDADGYLYFLGRVKEIIRRGGENISPFEIETELLKHPAIHDAAVVAEPDPIWGEEIKAVIVADQDFDPAEVRRFLTGRIATFMLPRYVQLLDEIPRTETHKIQRGQMQANRNGLVDLLAEVTHD